MIAYVPGRRRTARSVIRKWLLVIVGAAAAAGTVTAAAVVAHDAIPERAVVVVYPTAVVVPTAVPYEPKGPDPSLPAMYSSPLKVPLAPRTAIATELRVGPGESYLVVGVLQEGAPVEVAGRDEGGGWLRVVFPPHSGFSAWLPTRFVLDAGDIEALPVVPVSLP